MGDFGHSLIGVYLKQSMALWVNTVPVFLILLFAFAKLRQRCRQGIIKSKASFHFAVFIRMVVALTVINLPLPLILHWDDNIRLFYGAVTGFAGLLIFFSTIKSFNHQYTDVGEVMVDGINCRKILAVTEIVLGTLSFLMMDKSLDRFFYFMFAAIFTLPMFLRVFRSKNYSNNDDFDEAVNNPKNDSNNDEFGEVVYDSENDGNHDDFDQMVNNSENDSNNEAFEEAMNNEANPRKEIIAKIIRREIKNFIWIWVGMPLMAMFLSAFLVAFLVINF